MPIPESQLETWAHQGSVTQSAETYATIKRALEHPEAAFDNRDFKVFLQGSYGNDTNIYAESDVDVVIRYDGAFFHNADQLPAEQAAAFHAAYPGTGTYSYDSFKAQVRAALERTFKGSVKTGSKKAIKITANGSRRNADVVVAFEYRRYLRFTSPSDDQHVTGICFFTQDTGTRVTNYPKQHSENCSAKHAATKNYFKPLVRIFKNMRSKLVEDGTINDGLAPSYYVEGLLYNVPNDKFVGNYRDAVLNILTWLHETSDRKNFVCVNKQFYLLRDNAHECWPTANGEQFINAIIKLWNDW